MKIISAQDHGQYSVEADESLMMALSKIDRNKLRCVFVVNKNRQLIGVLADGDIRREILKGISTSISVNEVSNRGVKFIISNSATDLLGESQAIFESHPDIGVIPIVDEGMTLLSVVCKDLMTDMQKFT